MEPFWARDSTARLASAVSVERTARALAALGLGAAMG